MGLNTNKTITWLADQLVETKKLAQRALQATSLPQLATSSIEQGSIQEYDGEGTLVSVVGEQFDGTHTVVSVSGPIPPEPTPPIITLGPNQIEARWSGKFVAGEYSPMDFSHVSLHLSDQEFFDPDNTTQRATITGESGDAVMVMVEPGEWYAAFVAVSESGKWSDMSEIVYCEVPEAIDPGALTDELIQIDNKFLEVDQVMADNAVVLDKLNQDLELLGDLPQEVQDAVSAVASKATVYTGDDTPVGAKSGDLWYRESSKVISRYDGSSWQDLVFGENAIADDAIGPYKIAYESVLAGNIAAGAVVAGNIDAGAVTAETIAANAITAEKVAANAITAEKILAGAISTNHMAANSINADRLVAGSVTATELRADAINGKTITGSIFLTFMPSNLSCQATLQEGVLTLKNGDVSIPTKLEVVSSYTGLLNGKPGLRFSRDTPLNPISPARILNTDMNGIEIVSGIPTQRNLTDGQLARVEVAGDTVVLSAVAGIRVQKQADSGSNALGDLKVASVNSVPVDGGPWTKVALVSPWADYSGGGKYREGLWVRKTQDSIQISWMIKGGALNSNIALIPAGFHAPYNHIQPCVSAGALGFVQWDPTTKYLRYALGSATPSYLTGMMILPLI